VGARLRGLVLPAILTLAALAVLVSLGDWQLRRLAWKEDLIARATERPAGPVRDLPTASEWASLDIADAEYRPFRLHGRFLHDKEARVFTSLADPNGRYGGPGYWIVTPVALSSGGTVLVNRGFVPDGKESPGERGETLGGEPISAVGLLRPDESPHLFTPQNQPDRNMFFARNIEAIAAAKRLNGPMAPFTIDLIASETPPGGLPQAGETRMTFVNNHLQYAITWYGLAAALLAVFASFAWTRLRGGPRLAPRDQC
jgi:surfeit locus 1 family protein